MKKILVLVLFFPALVFSQKKLYFTLQYGMSNYHGDLQEKFFTFEQSHKVLGVGLALRVNPQFYLHGTLMRGKVAANDALSSSAQNRARNLYFVSTIYEAATTAEFNLYDLRDRAWTPYAFAGLAIFRFNPWGDRLPDLRRYSTEGQGFIDGRKPYRIIEISAPIGLGIRIRVSKSVNLGYQIGFRPTISDYIDDVSKSYVDEDLLRQNRGETAVQAAFRGNLVNKDAPYPAAGTPRGNPGNKDMYYFSTIRLSIGLTNDDGKLFGKKVMRGSTICPKF